MDKALKIYNEALLESNLAESDTDNVIREISKKHAVRSFLSIVGFEKGYLKGVILDGKKEGVIVLDLNRKSRQYKVSRRSRIALERELLKLVKKKGVLVKKMDVKDDFLLDTPHIEYKKSLGSVFVKGRFGKPNSVYVVYEDFDRSIKYYDYPQSQYKESAFRNRFMPLLIVLMSYLAMLVITLIKGKGADSILEFVLYFLMINLILNLCYVAFSFWAMGREINRRIKGE